MTRNLNLQQQLSTPSIVCRFRSLFLSFQVEQRRAGRTETSVLYIILIQCTSSEKKKQMRGEHQSFKNRMKICEVPFYFVFPDFQKSAEKHFFLIFPDFARLYW
jgi:hypothetical protein